MAISESGDPPAPSRGEPGSASRKVESIVSTQRLLTINPGSSSLKAALYRLQEDTTGTPELRAEASRIGGRGGGLRLADARGETLDERREDREGQEAPTTCDPTSRRWAPGEAAWERSLRVQRYSYVFESAGETCRVEPA